MDNEGTVIDMILRNEELAKEGSFGSVLYNFVTKIEDEEIEYGNDDFVNKVKMLIEAEKEDKLMWMTLSAWNSMNIIARNFLIEVVNPLIYDGVFFKEDLLIDNIAKLFFCLQDGTSLVVLKFHKSKKVIFTGPDSTNYSSIKFKTIEKLDMKLVDRVYYKENNKILLKGFNNEK